MRITFPKDQSINIGASKMLDENGDILAMVSRCVCALFQKNKETLTEYWNENEIK